MATYLTLVMVIGPRQETPVSGVSEKASFKPVSSATQTGYEIEILLVASLHTILSTKRVTKALIRLRGCAGWSAPVLFVTPENRFSHTEAHMISFQSVYYNATFFFVAFSCHSLSLFPLKD